MNNKQYLSEEELEKLIKYIDSGEERLKDAKRIVCKNTIDFNIWYKYSIPKERCNYPSMLGVNTLIGRLINDKISWLKETEFRDMILTLDFLLEAIEILHDEGKLTQKEIEDIKREFIQLNFGSMVNLW